MPRGSLKSCEVVVIKGECVKNVLVQFGLTYDSSRLGQYILYQLDLVPYITLYLSLGVYQYNMVQFSFAK